MEVVILLVIAGYRFLEEPFFWGVFAVLILIAYRMALNLFNALPFEKKLFSTTTTLRQYAANPKTPRFALEYAHAMREAARHHITSPYSERHQSRLWATFDLFPDSILMTYPLNLNQQQPAQSCEALYGLPTGRAHPLSSSGF